MQQGIRHYIPPRFLNNIVIKHHSIVFGLLYHPHQCYIGQITSSIATTDI